VEYSGAYALDPDGKKTIDFDNSNLHLLGYSIPVKLTISLSELRAHLHSLPDQPDAILYITSYYQERWGFCVAHRQRKMITEEGEYAVMIDSELKDGHLTYAELRIPGERRDEVFFSAYVCHPSTASNECSGPIVTAFLSRWLLSQKRKYSYRVMFIPETTGSITYLSRNLDEMQHHIITGYNVTALGNDRDYSFLPSRQEDSLSDHTALQVLKLMHPYFVRYTYLDQGSDERQYCAHGVHLLVASVMRSKYGTYPEYHTSLDRIT